jgi:hypothetical protein
LPSSSTSLKLIFGINGLTLLSSNEYRIFLILRRQLKSRRAKLSRHKDKGIMPASQNSSWAPSSHRRKHQISMEISLTLIHLFLPTA